MISHRLACRTLEDSERLTRDNLNNLYSMRNAYSEVAVLATTVFLAMNRMGVLSRNNRVLLEWFEANFTREIELSKPAVGEKQTFEIRLATLRKKLFSGLMAQVSRSLLYQDWLVF